MSRRKNTDRPAEQPVHKPPTRVPRRKRRKPAGAKAQIAQASNRGEQRNTPQDEIGRDARPAPLKTSRVPRSAEPPPANPNVFSYTFTIWKSS